MMLSTSAQDWYYSVKSFTQDSAVGCSVGYIMGLGDRHLDNILVNFDTGNLIHVDFSVIFNKGETLKIPETVPCRLTQNFVNTLQYPGLKVGRF